MVFPTLQGEQNADVCIIGGGFTGLSAAIHLRERGYSVILLEANRLAWGASGRNGGHVGVGQRVDQDRLENMVGMEHARQLWEIGLEANDTVAKLIERFSIDCELKQGNLHVASKAGENDEFREYAEHLQRHYNHNEISYVEPAEVAQMTSGQGFHGGLLDIKSKHLHPLKFAQGLAKAAVSLGAQLYEQSRVLSYSEGGKVTVNTAAGTVTASDLDHFLL